MLMQRMRTMRMRPKISHHKSKSVDLRSVRELLRRNQMMEQSSLRLRYDLNLRPLRLRLSKRKRRPRRRRRSRKNLQKRNSYVPKVFLYAIHSRQLTLLCWLRRFALILRVVERLRDTSISTLTSKVIKGFENVS